MLALQRAINYSIWLNPYPELTILFWPSENPENHPRCRAKSPWEDTMVVQLEDGRYLPHTNIGDNPSCKHRQTELSIKLIMNIAWHHPGKECTYDDNDADYDGVYIGEESCLNKKLYGPWVNPGFKGPSRGYFYKSRYSKFVVKKIPLWLSPPKPLFLPAIRVFHFIEDS